MILILIKIATNINILQQIKKKFFFAYVHFLKANNLRADGTST